MKNRRYEERRPGGGGATNLNFTSDSTAPSRIVVTHWGHIADLQPVQPIAPITVTVAMPRPRSRNKAVIA